MLINLKMSIFLVYNILATNQVHLLSCAWGWMASHRRKVWAMKTARAASISCKLDDEVPFLSGPYNMKEDEDEYMEPSNILFSS